MRLLLLLVLCMPLVTALTASPAQHTVYTPDGAAQYSVTVRNDEDRSIDVTVVPSGPFAEDIEAPASFALDPGEQRVMVVRVTVRDVQPGTLEGGLLIESRSAAGGTVSASGAVFHTIRLVTPEQGAFLDGELIAASSSVGSPTAVTLVLRNTGTEPVNAAVQLSAGDELLSEQAVALAPGAVQNVVAEWTPQRLGQYALEANAQYAGKELVLRQELTVGELSVSIVDVTFGAFVSGSPFRVSVITQSAWGQPLPVTASAAVLQDGRVIHAGESVPLTIAPGDSAAIPVFLESSGLREGEAALRVQLSYAGRQETLTTPIYIGEDAITIQPSGAAEEKVGWAGISLAALFVLIVIIIFIRRRRSSMGKGV